MVFHDADAEVFVPHRVDSDPGFPQPVEDFEPGCVADEPGVVGDFELVREQAELVDPLGVVAVSDGTDEDQLGAFCSWLR